jgi:hypothetical protein
MAKLVVVYYIGDDCTWSAEQTQPLEYESPEALYVDLEAAIKLYLSDPLNEKGDVRFGNIEFDLSWFINCSEQSGKLVHTINMPEILTLDEWFNKYSVH